MVMLHARCRRRRKKDRPVEHRSRVICQEGILCPSRRRLFRLQSTGATFRLFKQGELPVATKDFKVRRKKCDSYRAKGQRARCTYS